MPKETGDQPTAKTRRSALGEVDVKILRVFRDFVDAHMGDGTGLSFEELAAQRGFKSSSTVWRQIKQLEGAFGVELFQQVGRKASPTGKGRELAVIVDRLLGDLEEWRASHKQTEWLVLGAGAVSTHSLAIPNLTTMSDYFKEAVARQQPAQREVNPEDGIESRIHLKNRRSTESVEDLLSQQIDLAIVRKEAVSIGGRVKYEGLGYELLGKVGYVMLIAKRTADPRGVTDLAGLSRMRVPVVTLSGRGEFYRRLLEGMHRHSLPLNLQYRLDYFSDCVAAVRSAEVAAIVPWTATVGEPDEDQFHRWEIPMLRDAERELVLAWNPLRVGRRGFLAVATEDQDALVNKIRNCLAKTLENALPSWRRGD